MTDTIYAWSTTAADNGASDASINFAENQLPNTVNNSNRAVMARIRELLNDLGNKETSTGSGNAYAVASSAAGATLRDGETITFVPNHSNTGACTLNVDGRGAKPWRPKSGVAFDADNILSGVPVTAHYKLSSDEWLSPGTGYYVTNLASGVALQTIAARLPQIGDAVISLSPTVGAGRIRLTEATQSLLKADWPELNSWLSGHGYPWGSAATTFNLPPAAGYFLRFAATSSSIDTSGARAAGSTQSDQNKTATVPSTGLTAASSSSTTVTFPGVQYVGTAVNSFAGGGANNTPGGAAAPTATAATSTTTTVGGSATLPGGDEVRTKNVAFHVEIIASTALAVAQVAAVGLAYKWDSGTSAGDPGAGRVRGNNATLASITNLYINPADAYADVSAYISSWIVGDDIMLTKVAAQANRVIFRVAGAPALGSGYYTVPVTLVSAAGTLTNNDNLFLQVNRGGPTTIAASTLIRWMDAAAQRGSIVGAASGAITYTATLGEGHYFNGGIVPGVNDSASLGIGVLAWSDLFLATSGTVNFGNSNALITHSAGSLAVNVPWRLPSYTVAGLPTGAAGDTAYASNGRKNGEGAGAGTGVMVFKDATAWRACDTGATVAA